jgi:hypothetical protein
MNMIQPLNGLQSEPEQAKPKGRFTGERLLRERPRIYRRVVELLAEPGMSINQITKVCRVSELKCTFTKSVLAKIIAASI